MTQTWGLCDQRTWSCFPPWPYGWTLDTLEPYGLSVHLCHWILQQLENCWDTALIHVWTTQIKGAAHLDMPKRLRTLLVLIMFAENMNPCLAHSEHPEKSLTYGVPDPRGQWKKNSEPNKKKMPALRELAVFLIKAKCEISWRSLNRREKPSKIRRSVERQNYETRIVSIPSRGKSALKKYRETVLGVLDTRCWAAALWNVNEGTDGVVRASGWVWLTTVRVSRSEFILFFLRKSHYFKI